jgi:hypothetical protein
VRGEADRYYIDHSLAIVHKTCVID